MTWPDVPLPWSRVPYYATKYRTGYRTAYKNAPARLFTNPRAQGALAYFAGFNDGTADRKAGVFHEQAIPVPEQFSSGFAHKAYRGGYRLAREAIEARIPPPIRIELFFKNRELFTDNSTWGSGTAYDAGWRAGALSVGVLSPPLPNEKPTEIPQ